MSTACNVVAHQEARLRRELRGAGLRPHRFIHGPDRIHYWSGSAAPERPTVVLVHGFGAAGTVQWGAQVEALHESYRVIVPDLLWFGESLSVDEDFSIEHQVRAVHAILDDAGVAQAHFVGVSYGGLVSYSLASTQPERARSLVMVDSPGRAYTQEDYAELKARFQVNHPTEIFIPEEPEGLDRIFALGYHEPPWIPGWVVDQIYDRYFSRFRREQSELLKQLFANFETLVAGPDYTGPALLVWGRHDPVFPLPIGERLQKRIPQSRLVVIDNAAHAPNVERADEVNAAIVSFLQGVSSQREATSSPR